MGIGALIKESIRSSVKCPEFYTHCKIVSDCLDPAAETIGVEDLRSLIEAANSRGVSQTAVAEALRVALRENRLESGEFASWAKSQMPGILKIRRLGSALTRLLETDAWRRSLIYSYKSPVRSRRGIEACTVVQLDFDDATAVAFLREFLDSIPPEILRPGERHLIERLAESLGFVPSSAALFGSGSFSSQLSWCDRIDDAKTRNDARRMVRRLHLFAVAQCSPGEGGFGYEAGLTEGALKHDRICSLWQDGYRAVLYNPLDPVPTPTKWLLFPSKDECRLASFKPDKPHPLDFTVGDGILQSLVKDWAWHGGLSSAAVRRAPEFATALSEKIAARGARLVSRGKVSFLVDASTLTSFLKDALASYSTPSSRRHVKGWLRLFLEFGESVGVLQVEPTCYMHLATTAIERGSEASDADAITLDELKLLSSELERRSAASLIDELVYSAFCVQALTPLRISEILTIRENGLDHSPREGVRAVRVARKTSHGAFATIQVPETAHRMLVAVRTATEGARANAEPDVADYLFIHRTQMGAVSLLDGRMYRSKLKEAAEAVGIKGCNPRNLRKRYMTEVVEKGVAKNLSRLALRPLTGHSSDAVTNKFYLREDIRNYLEAVHGVEIGTPRILGAIEADFKEHEHGEDIVEGGTGICRNPECSVSGTVTCLMCSGFLTTPRFIPEMREAIVTLDNQIGNALPHDREHLFSVKRLYLAYLGKMMEIADTEGASNA